MFCDQGSGEKESVVCRKISLFCDLFQLPSIEDPQLFQSPIWKHYQMISLKENCRQSEDKVHAQLLNRIRIGNHNSEDLKALSMRVCGTGHPIGPQCRSKRRRETLDIAMPTPLESNKDLDRTGISIVEGVVLQSIGFHRTMAKTVH